MQQAYQDFNQLPEQNTSFLVDDNGYTNYNYNEYPSNPQQVSYP